LTTRIDLRTASKKTLESLALAGGFDSLGEVHRAQYFYAENEGEPVFLDKAIKYGSNHQQSINSAQASLFGGDAAVEIPEPKIPECEPWSRMEKLSREKEVVGIYLSGHPLDDFRFEIKHFCNAQVKELSDLEKNKKRKEMRMAGIVTEAQHRISKNGKPYGVLVLEGYEDSHRFMLFGDDYVKFKPYLNKDWFLFLCGRVQKKPWKDSTEIEFKIHKIELLSEIREKLSKTIKLKVDVNEVNNQLIQDLQILKSEAGGSCLLQFSLIDRKQKEVIELKSRSIRTNLTNDLIDHLERHPAVELSVN
jgi:DNA polymerase-3 subunit alpha